AVRANDFHRMLRSGVEKTWRAAAKADRISIANSRIEQKGKRWASAREEEASQHAGQHPVRWLVTIDERLDVHDDLLAHVDPGFLGRRAHMGQQHHLVLAGKFQEARI